MTGMCVGEKRKVGDMFYDLCCVDIVVTCLCICCMLLLQLTIPAAFGYGDRGAGAKIPGGATLVFEVEMLQINGENNDL